MKRWNFVYNPYVGTDSGINLDEVRSFLDKKVVERKARIKSRFEQAERDFPKIVNCIISEFNPKRIYQWGSLLYPERFSEISDIDIAVEVDLPPEEFFRMLIEVDNITNLPVDLVEIDKIHPYYADTIITYGKLSYERG